MLAPLMSRLFSLHPWDVERLTYTQWLLYRQATEEALRGPS